MHILHCYPHIDHDWLPARSLPAQSGSTGQWGRLSDSTGRGGLGRRVCEMRETPVNVVGTLVSDMKPRRVGPDGILVLKFLIACNERRFDSASESWVNGDSLYLSVNCWR